MKKRRLYYGWFETKDQTFRVSKMPPDSPIRPSLPFQSRMDAEELAKRARSELLWIPALTPDLMTFQASL